MNQFEVSVKYTKELPNSTLKRVSEKYLLAKAESFTEAEAVAHASILNEIRGETSVESIKKAAFQEIIYAPNNEGDWFKCSTTYKSVNPDTDKESVIKNTYLVQADNIDGANEVMKKFMGEMKDEFEIPSISKTTILGVIEDRVVKGRATTTDSDTSEEE